VDKKDALILSFDLGTTSIKIGLFSGAGELLKIATREQELMFPKPNRVEQSLTKLWELISEATREVFYDLDANKLVALVLTNQRGSVVPIGKDGEPLSDLMVWMDQRGLAQLDWLQSMIGNQEYYRLAGHPIAQVTGVSKALWLQQEAPEIWEKTAVVGAPQTVILKWLGCDEFVVDHASGSYLFPCDLRKKRWSKALADKLSFPLEKLPKLVPSTAIVGQLGSRASNDLGLPEGVPIVAGGGDGQCAAAGTGVVVPGCVMVNIGTATGVQVYLSEPELDPSRILNLAAHVVPDAWEMEGHTQASGIVFRWFRDEFGGVENLLETSSSANPYDVLVDQALDAPPGGDGLIFLPTFNGSTAPFVDPHARGAFIGLKLSHKRKHIIRAVLEGISLEIRGMLEAILELGVPVDEVRLAGGGSKNQHWNQMHADIFGLPIRTVENPDAAMVGGAMCAAVALDFYPGFKEASEAFVQLGPIIEPREANIPIYRSLFERYVNIFSLLSEHGAFSA